MADGQGIPLGGAIAAAPTHAVTLVGRVLAQIKMPRNGPGVLKSRPKRLKGDYAYDSETLRKDLHNHESNKAYLLTQKNRSNPEFRMVKSPCAIGKDGKLR
jgi:hypothetical protein